MKWRDTMKYTDFGLPETSTPLFSAFTREWDN